MCGCEAKDIFFFISFFSVETLMLHDFSFTNNCDVFLLLLNTTAVNSVNEIIFTKRLDDAFELLNVWSNSDHAEPHDLELLILSYDLHQQRDCCYKVFTVQISGLVLLCLSALDLKKII